jgi:tRNA-dihydrouridine synthase C
MSPYIQLAPMEGVVDWVLREMLSEVGGLDRLVTEFVRVTDRRLPDHVFHKYSPELLQGGKTQAGTPVYIQLLGGQAEPLAENAQRAVELGAPGIDLNFGCPAKTVNRHDGGAVILRDPQRVFQLSRAVRQAVPAAVPVTVKVRLGFDRKDLRTEIAQESSNWWFTRAPKRKCTRLRPTGTACARWPSPA